MNEQHTLAWHALLQELQRLNRTELYQLCRANGLRVPISLTREQYMHALIGPPTGGYETEQDHQIDNWRLGLSGFVRRHWHTLRAQLTCPISSGDFRSCWGCIDQQVLSCANTNERNHERIKQMRPRDD